MKVNLSRSSRPAYELDDGLVCPVLDVEMTGYICAISRTPPDMERQDVFNTDLVISDRYFSTCQRQFDYSDPNKSGRVFRTWNDVEHLHFHTTDAEFFELQKKIGKKVVFTGSSVCFMYQLGDGSCRGLFSRHAFFLKAAHGLLDVKLAEIVLQKDEKDCHFCDDVQINVVPSTFDKLKEKLMGFGTALVEKARKAAAGKKTEGGDQTTGQQRMLNARQQQKQQQAAGGKK